MSEREELLDPAGNDAPKASPRSLDEFRRLIQAENAALDESLREMKRQEREEYALNAIIWLVGAALLGGVGFLFFIAGRWAWSLTEQLRAANNPFRWLPMAMYVGSLIGALCSMAEHLFGKPRR
jgi:preprotein translocase subunit Sss1